MKSAVKIACIALVAVAFSVLLIWGSGILWAKWFPVKLDIPALSTLAPADQLVMGEDGTIDFEVTLPAGVSPENTELQCGKGSSAIALPVWQKRRWKWNKVTWRFTAALRALVSGEIPEGAVTFDLVTLTGRRSGEKYRVAIPEFSSVIPAGEKSGGELLLAGVMSPPPRKFSALFEHAGRNKYIYIAAILLLTAALWLIIRYFRRRNLEKQIPCWEAALAAIAALETQCRHGDILPVAGYTVLMDILRNYLELRFDLPVSRQTASEFAFEVTRSSSPLPEEFRLPLNLFFETSDLIRFAKAPADCSKLLDAARDLAGFIRATVPVVENDGNASDAEVKS